MEAEPLTTSSSAAVLHIGHRFAIESWNFEPTVVPGAFIICSFYAYFSIRQPGGIDWLRAASFTLAR